MRSGNKHREFYELISPHVVLQLAYFVYYSRCPLGVFFTSCCITSEQTRKAYLTQRRTAKFCVEGI